MIELYLYRDTGAGSGDAVPGPRSVIEAHGMTIYWIDTVEGLKERLGELEQAQVVAVDLEWVNKDPKQLCLLQLATSATTAYVFDIVKMGDAAFSTKVPRSYNPALVFTLRTLLENPNVRKVLFDARRDNEALVYRDVHLTNVYDVQLAHPSLLLRRGVPIAQVSKLMGLADVIKAHTKESKDVVQVKKDVREAFTRDPVLWATRPVENELLIVYAAIDVAYLFQAYQEIQRRLPPKYYNQPIIKASHARLGTLPITHAALLQNIQKEAKKAGAS